MNINYAIIGVISFVIILIVGSLISDYFWRKKKLQNFPIKYRGKIFWFSRSVAVVLFTFCKNAEGKLCVLANRRGNGTPDFQGYWNAPCGYLDFDESGEEACQRETYEETGVFVNTSNIIFNNANSDPKDSNRQNVTLRYMASINDKLTSDFKFDTSHSEQNEVSDVKWIPIDELENYKWAFGHKELIMEASNKLNNK